MTLNPHPNNREKSNNITVSSLTDESWEHFKPTTTEKESQVSWQSWVEKTGIRTKQNKDKRNQKQVNTLRTQYLREIWNRVNEAEQKRLCVDIWRKAKKGLLKCGGEQQQKRNYDNVIQSKQIPVNKWEKNVNN